MTPTTSIIKAINQVLLNLLPEKQQEVLNFVLDIQNQPKTQNPVFKEQKSKAVLVQELRELFKELQSDPEIQKITEEEIKAEIDPYREGK
ncbi:MAG: hypothetical protein F6K40_17960 [Okeania sp. SIO3I5]|uniref:hypothetical protein n=1 Tax=Okeania sp. SIO3I5 TaxID=2607805 RepID=UPI0013BD7946|nr:hypothetical protein [Okeania sp. SIO3I5]NEQ38043.1 hypothetical protein [Okeania sp. SIO3I5]